MLTNVSRKDVFKRFSDRAAGVSYVNPISLLDNIDEALRKKIAPPRLLARCFELANLCHVLPDQEVVKKIAAAVTIACDDKFPLPDRIFVVTKLIATMLNWEKAPIQRLLLTGSSKELAESIYQAFLQFSQTPADARRIGEELLVKAEKSDTAFPDYFLRDLKIALHATAQEGTDQIALERKDQAWAALQYFAKDKDAIPDALGYRGLVDDIYVMRRVSRKTLPQLDELEAISNQVFQQLPFLHELRFHRRGEYGHHVSEYLTITCLPLFDKLLGYEKSIAHISLVEEPTLHSISASLILAFGALYNFIGPAPTRRRYEELTSPDTLEIGQEVTLRENGTRWIFQGLATLEEGGEEFLRLEGVGRNSGVFNHVRRNTPLSVQSGRARERIGGAYKLNTAELLFDLDRFDYSQYQGRQRIFLVCNRNRYEEYLDRIFINEISWKKAIPIGVISSSRGTEFINQIEVLSGGSPESVVLYLVPNIRTLIDYHFSGSVDLLNAESIVIVDGSSEMSTLDRLDELRELGASVNLFASSVMHSQGFSQLLDQGFTSFRWESELLNIYRPIGPKGRKFQDWEYSLGASLHQNVISHQVFSEDADLIYHSTQTIERQLKKEETNQHARKILEDVRDITLAILRLNKNCPADMKEFENKLLTINKLVESIQSSRLINEEQLSLLVTHIETVVTRAPPALEAKAKTYASIAAKLNRPKYFSANASSAVEGSYLQLDSGQISARDMCLLAFWPGQRRVARLVNSKPQSYFHVVLFQHELAWLRSFRRNYYAIPTPESAYERLRVASEILADKGAAEFDDEETKHLSRLKQVALDRVYDADERLARATRLIYAEGNIVIFASARSQFSVVISNTGKTKIVERPGAQIQAGVQLAYLPDAEKGAIRETADRRYLEVGTRELATSWRTALQRFFEERVLTLEALQTQLASAGVIRGLETIQQWIEDEDRIYPTDPKNVIPRIFEVIGKSKTTKEIDAILQAINAVQSAHMKAGEYLENMLLEALNDGDRADTELQVLEVIAVEECDYQVPYRLLSQPHSVHNI